MTREERIREARRLAAANTPMREAAERERTARLHDAISDIGPEESQRRVTEAARSESPDYLGPQKTPGEWRDAIEIARSVAVQAARHRRTITYGEIRYAVLESVGKLVGWSMFAELVMSINKKADGVMLSSIVVHKDDGLPGQGFLPYALSQGFDEPLSTLQRHVFEHFGSANETALQESCRSSMATLDD